MVELSLNFNVPEGKFSFTNAAANRIMELIEMEGRADQALIIKVIPGGCAGFSYDLGWVPVTENGKKFEHNGAIVIIKETDIRLLDGAELDYIKIDQFSGSKFDIKNPNAQSTCGCGKSWS